MDEFRWATKALNHHQGQKKREKGKIKSMKKISIKKFSQQKFKRASSIINDEVN